MSEYPQRPIVFGTEFFLPAAKAVDVVAAIAPGFTTFGVPTHRARLVPVVPQQTS